MIRGHPLAQPPRARPRQTLRRAASWPQAALHGERVGRILVATRSGDAVGLAAQDADVAATRLGRATGSALTVELGGSSLRWTLEQLTERWEQAF